MDVHTTNYTLSCYTVENDMSFATIQVEPDYKNILKYLENIKKNYDGPCEFLCGYEAGCLGFTLYENLKRHNVSCIILAPTSMPVYKKTEIKTDKRDAMKIAKCLAYNTYTAVHIPTKEDSDVKEYIRMRDAHKIALKKVKQQILAFCTRHGFRFSEGKNYWTQKHLKWLRGLNLDGLLREILDEYLATYTHTTDKLERFDKRIAELAAGETYAKNVQMLSCMIGIRTHTALALLVETGDFHRFKKAEQYASFLGLVPGEHSSSDNQRRLGITKAGNSHLRRLLIEAAQCYNRGKVGYKSKALKARQYGNSPEIIAYADKANERLRRKFYRMVLKSNKKHNVAVTAVARELSCFIWGMMTEQTA
jgi:transposase